MSDQSVNLIYKLEGNFEEGLDVFELAPILLSVGELVRESNKVINPGGRELTVSIKPFEEGSFIIDIIIQAQTHFQVLLDLVNAQPVQQAKNVLEWLGLIKGATDLTGLTFFGLIKWLKGKPQKVEKIENGYNYTNKDGEVKFVTKEVNNIYNNCTFQKTINNGFAQPLTNDRVEKIKFYVKDEEETSTNELLKEDIEPLNQYVEADLSDTNQKRTVDVNAVLNLLKVVFEKNRKWDFIYNGNKISASITDPDFYTALLDRKYSFTSGDTLEVVLQIYQEFDQRVNTYLNVDYKVIKVNKHVPVLLPLSLGM